MLVNGNETTRERKLLAWAGDMTVQRAELRRTRMELAQAREEIRVLRAELSVLRMEVRPRAAAVVVGGGEAQDGGAAQLGLGLVASGEAA